VEDVVGVVRALHVHQPVVDGVAVRLADPVGVFVAAEEVDVDAGGAVAGLQFALTSGPSALELEGARPESRAVEVILHARHVRLDLG
jgi:hypothetical protein